MTNQHQQTPHAPRHNPQKSSQTDARDKKKVELTCIPIFNSNLNIPATVDNLFTTWHLLQRLSQSSIEGRNGSNLP